MNDLAWMAEGACVGRRDLDFFVQSDDENFAPMRRACLSVCSDCPVKDTCLAWALENEKYGIWGGKTASQREAMTSGPYRPEVFPDDPFAPAVPDEEE